MQHGCCTQKGLHPSGKRRDVGAPGQVSLTLPACSLWSFAQCLTSSLCTSFFLMAFWAAALVAMRSPSAASRRRCCCSSLSGWAAAPCGEQETHHTSQRPQGPPAPWPDAGESPRGSLAAYR